MTSCDSRSQRRARAGTTGRRRPSSGLAADEADAQARAAARERDDLQARAALARERLSMLEQSLAEREGLPPAARALAEDGERLALSAARRGAGRRARGCSGARPACLGGPRRRPGSRLGAVCRRPARSGLGSLVVLVGRDPREVVASLPVLEPDELLASQVPAVTRDGIGWDPVRGELWFAGETAEAVLLELEAQRNEPRRAGADTRRPRPRRPRSRQPPQPSALAPPPPHSRPSRTCGTCGARIPLCSPASMRPPSDSTRPCASRPRAPAASRRRSPPVPLRLPSR